MVEIHSFPTPETERVPHSVEAEQQLIGALLLNNDILTAITAIADQDHFYDPVHGRIYAQIKRLVQNDKLASPVTLRAVMGDDEGLQELGGGAYLVRLAGGACATYAAEEYARLIVEKAEKRNLIETFSQGLRDLHADASAPGDVSARVSAALDGMDFKTTGVKPVSFLSAVTEAVRQANDIQMGVDTHSVPSGLGALDEIIPGFAPGELWLLAGRPSMGKSAVAMNIAMRAAERGHPVIFASLEMRPEYLAQRAISERTAEMGYGVAYRDMRRPDLGEDKMRAVVDAAREISEMPLWFLAREYASAELLPVGVKQSLRHYSGDKVPLVLVDYVQLVRSAKAKNRFEEVTEVSLALKGLAMSQGVPVLALSQLSRAVESRDDKRPMLSDLRESGQLEQDADGVLFCYRDAYYLEREKPSDENLDDLAAWQEAMERAQNALEIIVAKQRQGPIATAKMNVNLALNRIWDAPNRWGFSNG